MTSSATFSMNVRQGRFPPVHSPGHDLRGRLPLARLPSVPQVLLRLLELCQKDSTSINDIVTLIGSDVALAARIMNVASSASHYGRQKPSTLTQCVNILGLGMVKTLVINESIFQVFRRIGNERDFDLGRFWVHSLRCAAIARNLAKAVGQGEPDEAYLGGLLHDIGQLAMLATDPALYLPVFRVHDNLDELCRREQELFDLTHAEVGAWVIEKWELDSLLSDCVLYHHDQPERLGAAHPLIRCIRLANHLAALENGAPGEADELMARALIESAVDLSAVMERGESEMREMAEQLGIRVVSSEKCRDAQNDPPPARPDPVAEALADRVLDMLVVGSLPDDPPVEEHGGPLPYIAQAARILFDVTAALAFVPQEGSPGAYAAFPLHPGLTRGGHLGFVASRSDSDLAASLQSGPRLLGASRPDCDLLDEQLLRLVGKAGLLYLPLCDAKMCRGILVCSVEHPKHAEALALRLPCLAQFGAVAARLLAPAEDTGGRAQEHPALEAQRAHFRRAVHEASTPLSVIQNYLAVLEQKFADTGLGQREVGIVNREIARVGRILREAVTQPSPPAPFSAAVAPDGALRLNALVGEMLALCCPPVSRTASIEIETDFADDLPELRADGDQLRQLLINLFGNAVDALAAAGGRLSVSTSPWSNGAAATHAEIRIEDSGPGLPHDVLCHLYRPVLTDKGAHHQGLGLYIVGQLVRELGGLINCRSSARGTCFQILLPLGQ